MLYRKSYCVSPTLVFSFFMANQKSHRPVVLEELLADAVPAAVEEGDVEEGEDVAEEAEGAAEVDVEGDFLPFHFCNVADANIYLMI